MDGRQIPWARQIGNAVAVMGIGCGLGAMGRGGEGSPCSHAEGSNGTLGGGEEKGRRAPSGG